MRNSPVRVTFFRMQNIHTVSDKVRLNAPSFNKVLLVEASSAVREQLARLIKGVPRTVIIGQTADGFEAQRLFRELRPDSVVMGLQLPGIGGLGLLEKFKQENPDCVVMVLTTYTTDAFRKFCAQLGADHFFDKSRDFERVTEVLQDLIVHETWKI